MEKLTIRKIKFNDKENDYSKTEDFRILSTKKVLMQEINDYCELCELTTFQIIKEDTIKTEFDSKQFNNEEEINLTLKQASSEIIREEIYEDIMSISDIDNGKTIRNNVVLSRLVKLYY